MVDKTYIDSVLNPDPRKDQLPNLALRNLYQNNEVHPISVAQCLASQGVTTVTAFAIQFGETEAQAREKLDPASGLGPLSNLCTDRARWPFKRDGEVASYLCTRLDAKNQRSEIATARAAAQRDPTAKPSAVPLDRKKTLRATYRASFAQRYWPLVKKTTPHDLFWDDAQTRRDRIGYMPFYYIYEIRSADETISTNKQLTTDLQELIKLDHSTVLATTVTSIDEVVRRIMVFFLMATFIGE